MNTRQSRFCQEYVYGEHAGDAAAAYRDAGYSARSANANAASLRANQSIAAEIGRLTAARDAALQAKGIADRQYRIDAANHRWQLLEQVRDERAADERMVAVPGGTTGLMVRQYKQIGVGRAAKTVEEFNVDTGLLREWRELEKQVAQETGQWTEKRELTGKDGGAISLALIDAVIADGGDALA